MDNVVISLFDFCVVGFWFIFSVLFGLISVLVFLVIKILVLNKEKFLEFGFKFFLLFYVFIVVINLFFVFYKGFVREYREFCFILGYLYFYFN